MPVSRTLSAAVFGIDAYIVEVEVDLSPGLFYYSTVGLPDAAVRESQNRVLAALQNSGFEAPIKRITVNLAPADIRKEGSTFDLPIAISMLMCEGIIDGDMSDTIIFGELALDGRVKPVRGALPVAILARDKKIRRVIAPVGNAGEAAVVKGVEVIGVDSLPQTIEYLTGKEEIEPTVSDPSKFFERADHDELDFAEVKGQQSVKRALEIAAAGGHNFLMIGPPGSGKSMMAARLPTILPDITFDEAVETTKIHSICGKLGGNNFKSPLVNVRPFRSPHHTISDAGLIGGGTIPTPGEVSLAHNGVLFLDEFPEYKRNALEALRQPLEEGSVTISRSSMSLTFPSRFMLAAAMNPCPCGYYTDPAKQCACNAHMIRKYRSRISGPLMDRIDIHIEAPAVKYNEIIGAPDGEPSTAIRDRVNEARRRQLERFSDGGVYCNGQMSVKQIRRICVLDGASQSILKVAIEKLGLSARAHDKVLKLARTIADLEGASAIASEHVAEAVQYRSLDRDIY
ncbi:MG(2+) CHELATASE FAMILY PROTEIN / ComM-related protein [hydrothermal vent metagenome]|uniref:MG(2+) CHELATASE FAMILY PROTEIN / ComM-related protein n=1 Tax=hydrothermal vent metagenome TaxID=652676 RepID=A0A3B1C1M8_9ZZZZ